MKNLKKLFAVIVVVAMLATFAIPAFAATPSDVVGTGYEKAVGRLVALGIITGRPDGSYAPDDTITRAEFAAVVIRALGYDSAAAAAKGQTKFSDVSADYWASGYINLASSLGIINGRPDGTFGANDPVRYEEAITMIVRALGYEPKAKALGGYPAGYLAVASQENIDKGAQSPVGSFASRGLVAILVDNSLEVDMMEQTNFGTETKFEVIKGKTLINNYLKLKEYEVQITDVGSKIEVKYLKNYTNPDKAVGTKEKLAIYEGLSKAGLKDAFGKIWVKDNTIYAYKLSSNTYYGYVEAINGKSKKPDVTATSPLDPTAANQNYEITVAGVDIAVTVDTDVVKDYTSGTKPQGDDMRNLLDNKYYVRAVVENGIAEDITFYELYEGGIITSVEDDRILYTRAGSDRTLRNLDKAKSITVVINGELSDYSKLEEDMLFDYHVDGSNEHYLIVASDKKVEGELLSADVTGSPQAIYFGPAPTVLDDFAKYYSADGGKTYTALTSNDNLVDLLGEEVICYANSLGNVRYVAGKSKATADFYGYVISVDSDRNAVSRQIEVARVLDGEAVKVVYDMVGAAKEATTINAEKIYKFSLNAAGKISAVAGTSESLRLDSHQDEFNKNIDAIKDGSNYYYINKDTIILNKYDEQKKLFEIVDWSSIEGLNVPGNPAIDGEVIEDKGFAKLVVFTKNLDVITGTDQYVAFVKSTKIVDRDNYEVELVNYEGDSTYKLVNKNKVPPKNSFVVYTTARGNDSIKVVNTYSWNDANTYPDHNDNTKTGWKRSTAVVDQVYSNVYSIDRSTIVFTESPTTVFRVASDAVVYQVVNTSIRNVFDYKLADFTDVRDTDEVQAYVLNGLIKALFFKQP